MLDRLPQRQWQCRAMPAEQRILLAFLLTATKTFQLTVGSLNAAGVGMKFSASATADWYLAFFQWSESLKVEPEEVAFFKPLLSESMHFGSLSWSILYTIFLFTSTPLKLWRAFWPLPVHLFISGVYRVKLEQVSAKKGWREQERLHSVLSWRGVGEG